MNNEYYIDRYLDYIEDNLQDKIEQYNKDYELDLIKKNQWRFNNGRIMASKSNK